MNRQAHALLSSSGAHRWLACPPSARLEAQFPDSTSESAAEGTFAHELAELSLRHYLEELSDVELKTKMDAMKSGKTRFGDFYSASMKEYIGEYVDLVIEKYAEAKERSKDAILQLEQHLDFSEWVPKGFGRGDAIIIADGFLEVIDLKYGRSVPVRAEGNPQIRLYALGAYAKNAWLYNIEAARMTIFQPRNGGESSEELTIPELLAWGEKVRPIAELAYMGEGEFHAGEHCRFCRAATQCKCLADHEMEIEKYGYKAPKLLTDDEIADILRRVDNLTSWINQVKSYTLREAVEQGHVWPGFKLVEGRSARKILDAEQAEAILHGASYSDAQIYKPKELLSLTALEKLIGRKKLNELLAPVIDKPPGKPTLVPESDPRPAWNAAKDDFDVID